MNKQEFQQEYDRLTSINDYRGLAVLLRNTNFKTDSTRERALRMADEYDEQADIDDKLLENATQEQKDAYYFISNGPQKSLDDNIPTDSYSRRFAEAWNNLADDDNIIRIYTNGVYLDHFLEGSGISKDELSNYGITLTKNNVLEFTTDNTNKIKIYKGLESMSNNRWRHPSNVGLIGASIPSNYTFVHSDKKERQFDELINLNKEANEMYSSVMDKQSPYVLQTIVTGYMGEDDKRLQELFAAGGIDLQTFKEARSLLEEKYNRLLQNSSLTQYDVYGANVDNNGSEFLSKIDSSVERAKLDDEINQAMVDGRLHFAHASNGLAYGTMITIDQKLDKKGNPDDMFPSRKLFVKDLFKSEAENRLRDDTQTDAQLQYARHQTYGHTYRGKDGSTLENWTGYGDSADYKDEYGNVEHISKAEILNIIDDDIITRRLIDYYKKALYKNSNGWYYTKESKTIFGNRQSDKQDEINNLIIDNIKQSAINAMSQKYGNNGTDYVNLRANKLASVIMQNLNLNLE